MRAERIWLKQDLRVHWPQAAFHLSEVSAENSLRSPGLGLKTTDWFRQSDMPKSPRPLETRDLRG